LPNPCSRLAAQTTIGWAVAQQPSTWAARQHEFSDSMNARSAEELLDLCTDELHRRPADLLAVTGSHDAVVLATALLTRGRAGDRAPEQIVRPGEPPITP
jgi:hypothetical protein